MDVKRTLIVTHRPVVNKSWKDDFDNVVTDRISGNDNQKRKWDFGTLFDDEQHDKRKFYDLEKFANQSEDNHYVFFVSMQYLRLSELVNTKTQLKNKDKQGDMFGHNASKENEKLKADILNTDWDLVVIDEAHEGTRTALGKRVIDEFLKKEKTKMLHLSGTPSICMKTSRKKKSSLGIMCQSNRQSLHGALSTLMSLTHTLSCQR